MPILLYGSECWTLRHEDIRCLEVFQMCRLRWLLGVKLRDRVSNAEVRRKCNNQRSIEQQIRTNRLRSFGHVCRMGESRRPRQILNSNPPQSWRVWPRAPRVTWMHQVKEDVGRLQHSIDYAMQAAQNRDQWKGILRDVAMAPPAGRVVYIR